VGIMVSPDSIIRNTIIIPAYNEERRIEEVVNQYASYFQHSLILVVCNGCADGTVRIVGQLAAARVNVEFLEFKEKIGKGGALLEGFSHCITELVSFVDADESTSPHDLDGLVNVISSNDGVIGSRKLEASIILVPQSFLRRFLSRCFNVLVNALFSLGYRDTQCGAKVFRRETLLRVLPEMHSTGFEFDVELLWRLRRINAVIIEYPITWKHSVGSTFRLSQIPKMLMGLVRIRFF
jgi:dolichol-phosphate mannosyltransferase